MSGEGPAIVRPVPRRPFDSNRTDDGQQDSISPNASSSGRQTKLLSVPGGSDSTSSISRAASLVNLTSSTLFGIYSPSEEPETPWGTGAQTPVHRFTLGEQQDLSAIELDKEHSSMLRRMSTTRSPPRELFRPKQQEWSVVSLAPRSALLFVLGMGYGVLVTRLRDGRKYQHQQQTEVDGIMHPGLDWRYLVFWGATGVILGGLLPWLDGVWEDADAITSKAEVETDPVAAMEMRKLEQENEKNRPSTDWALVVRGIGAFVGIAFAIRRLPWTSSLQASATLALVNPFLWYLIDRSKAGFLLSTAVGLAGSAILLGLNPDMMMPPSGASEVDNAIATMQHHSNGTSSSIGMSSNIIFGGFASQETVESGVWMLSVLFCSCLCFGNIGRRLAWRKGAQGRGRWGGVR